MEGYSEEDITNEALEKAAQILKHIEEEVGMLVPDHGQYLKLQIALDGTNDLFYTIRKNCPAEKIQKIEKVIYENADLLNLSVDTDME